MCIPSFDKGSRCSSKCIGSDNIDIDNDGICNDQEIAGCMDVEACNYDPNATDDSECLIFASDDQSGSGSFSPRRISSVPIAPSMISGFLSFIWVFYIILK